MSNRQLGSHQKSEQTDMLNEHGESSGDDMAMYTGEANARTAMSRYSRGRMDEQTLTPENMRSLDLGGSVFRHVMSPVQSFRPRFETFTGRKSPFSSKTHDGTGRGETMEVKADDLERMARSNSEHVRPELMATGTCRLSSW
jgi:hypothetical protein